MNTLPENSEGQRMTAAATDLVTRPELNATIEALNRELSGITTKLDMLVSTKFDDARQMGAIQQQVKSLEDSSRDQAKSIHAIETEARKNQIAPRDALIKLLYDILKWVAGAGVGYLLSGGKLHL